MIKARIKHDEYHIPTRWSDLTYHQYINYSKLEDEHEILSLLSGIPIETIKQTEDDQLQKLVLLLGFLKVKFEPQEYDAPESIEIAGKKVDLIADIKEKSFGQKVYFHEVAKEHTEDFVAGIPELVSVYAQPDFDGAKFDINAAVKMMPLLEHVFFVDLYATAICYIKQMKKILEEEAEELSSTPDAEQEMAGVGMFKRFGIMNTIKALANNDVTKYAEVLEIEYNTIFTHMRMNKVQNDFNDNYRKVLEQKAKSNTK